MRSRSGIVSLLGEKDALIHRGLIAAREREGGGREKGRAARREIYLCARTYRAYYRAPRAAASVWVYRLIRPGIGRPMPIYTPMLCRTQRSGENSYRGYKLMPRVSKNGI